MSGQEPLKRREACALGVEVGHAYCEQCGDCLYCYAGEPCHFGGVHEPRVPREPLPDDGREVLVLYADDAPTRPGNGPRTGDVEYKFSFPLADGRRLELRAGLKTHANFVAMLAACAADDLDEQLDGEG